MARKPTNLGPAVDAEIEARTMRGESAQTIAAALGAGVSYRTISRRQQKLRGKVALPRPPRGLKVAAAAPESEESLPDDIPADLGPEGLEKWIKRIEKAAISAEARGAIGELGTLGRLIVSLAEHKRKATPIPKPDPSENPDMIAAAKRGREWLHKLVESAVGNE